MDAAKIVAWNIRKLRVERGWTQDALADAAEVDRTYVGRLERSNENPSLTVLEKLATALGVALPILVTAPAPGEPSPRAMTRGRKPKLHRSSVRAARD
jgi:transcriptional regulator with XRE-family HTH domain